jgi:HEAT repeat protein
MNKARALFFWTALPVFCFGAVFAAEEDPEIDGKPLSALLAQVCGANRGHQIRAARTLTGAPAELQEKIIPKVLPLLKSDRENDRFVAAQILGEYGPPAKAAVPDLLPMLEGTQFERNRAAAAKALGQILKDAQPSEEVEKVAVALTRKFNDDYDKYSDVRREAVRALGMIGPAAKFCIPHLTRALTDYQEHSEEHRMVRQQAAWTCGRMGPLAAAHMDRLLSMMQSEGEVLPEIVEAVGLIGPLNENVINNIVDKMESCCRAGSLDAWAFREKALEALGRFGPKAAPALPYLMKILRDTPDNRVAIEPLIGSVKTIGQIGPTAKDALPLLEKMKTYNSHPHAEIPKAKHDLLHKEAEAAIAKVKE